MKRINKPTYLNGIFLIMARVVIITEEKTHTGYINPMNGSHGILAGWKNGVA
jgi:hypothetical protein